MDIKAQDVKALREKTGAGMLDCKNALVKTEGDFAAAEKLLKEQGLAAVEKRSDRATNEGKIFVKVDGNKAVLVELACETDFVARNDDFNACGKKLLEVVLSKNLTTVTPELEDLVKEAASVIKENISLKRVKVINAASDEYLHDYIHGDGKIGVVVRFKANKPEVLAGEKVKTFVHDLALHIAAFNPTFLDKTQIPGNYVKEQEEIFAAQMAQDEKMQGKPEKVLTGILQGKISKHLAEICLVDQGFVKDEKQSVTKFMEGLGKEVGATLSISEFSYFRVGA